MICRVLVHDPRSRSLAIQAPGFETELTGRTTDGQTIRSRFAGRSLYSEFPEPDGHRSNATQLNWGALPNAKTREFCGCDSSAGDRIVGRSAAAITAKPLCAWQDAATDETVVLFDGSSLDHWRGYHDEPIGAGWKIVDGVLKFDGKGGGDLMTREAFEDFELGFEWAVTEGANSGVIYKVGLGDSAPFITGLEYQILDNDKHPDGNRELTSAAALYDLYPADGGKTKPVGQWNTGKIVIRGNQIQHWLNGNLVVQAEQGSDDWKERLAKSKFHDWEKFATVRTGHICLQDHGNEVWYRNITIRRLSPQATSNH